MSISSFQEKFLGKGCGNIVVGAFAVVLLGTSFSQCNRSKGDDPAQLGGGQGAVVARVGNIPVSLDSLQAGISTATTQMLGQMAQSGMTSSGLPFQYQSSIAARELETQLSRAALVFLVEKNGIKLTDEAILKSEAEKFQQSVDATAQRFITDKKLKPGYTPKDLEEALKGELQGQTLAQVRQSGETAVKAALADPLKRPEVLAMSAPGVLLGTLQTKFTPSETDLKASFDTYTTKRLLFTQKPSPTLPPAERATQALAELKAGKSFESLMDSSSDEIAQPNKKRSELTSSVGGAVMDSSPEYRELKGKPAGFVSAPVDTPEGKVIYKLVSIKNDLPKDFVAKKAKYTTDLANQRARAEVEKQLKEVLTSGSIKWENNGWKALFSVSEAMKGGPLALDVKLKSIVEESKKIVAATVPAEIQPATWALYLASTTLYNSSAANKAAMLDSRIEVLNLVLKTNQDYDLYSELVDLYAQKKDGAKLTENLVAASKANTSYDMDGQRKFGDIAGKSIKFKADGLISDDQLKMLEAQQALWRKAKLDYDSAVAEGKKQQEELKKSNEAELARQKAEEALQKANKPATGGSTGGGLLDGAGAPKK